MKTNDWIELTVLAAIWGAAFLFMRLAAPEFGAVALAAVRVTGAAVILLPLLAQQGQMSALGQHWKPIFLVGLTNSAIPFVLFAYAALTITAGLSSIFNATAPLFGAVVAWVWLKDRPGPGRVLGLAIGFAGVLWLAWDKAGFKPGAPMTQTGLALLACLGSTSLYGWSANFTKRYLTGVPPLASATGSQLSSALFLAIPAWWFWPASVPSVTAWTAVGLLALLCTGLAYVMYFRLIARVGPANAITVTFLIPVFGVLWGGLFLNERLTSVMAIGCAVIVVGTALATGWLRWPMKNVKQGES
jgi:drug/metabolite transporter (DMT)-like permease